MPKLRTLCKLFLIILIGLGIFPISISTKAKPQGGQVEAGDIIITDDIENAIDTLIKQSSQKGVINWQSFNIAPTEHTHFAQPGINAVTLNRVLGKDISKILGKLTATGKVFLINPSGIIFGPSSYVDVAGLLATTANITSQNFLSGNYHFTQGPNSNAKIINQGYIKIADNGLVFLIAPNVENATTGLIEANLGKVILGSTPANSAYVLDFYGDELLQFALPSNIESDIDNTITQSGKISAPGGKVLLSANTAKNIVDKSINMSGIIEADTISNKGGEIILSGGKKGIVSVTGEISARGKETGQRGGKVKITGEKVGLFADSKIDVSGDAGGGEVLIGADRIDNQVVSAARSTYVSPDASIFADAKTLGDGGDIIVWSDDATRFYGRAWARGGILGGHGGFVETSSKNWLDVGGIKVDTSAPHGITGTWLLDPYNIEIVSGTPPSQGTWDGSAEVVNIWTPNQNDAQLYIQDILTNLIFTDVSISTGTSGTQPGNITIVDPINYTGPSIQYLELIAANDIIINAAITGSNLELILDATNTININSGIDVYRLGLPDATVININTSTITTATPQTYNFPVFLETNTLLTGGDISFANTIEGPGGLGIDAQGNVVFSNTVGATSALNYLTVDATGNINSSASQIITTGNQTYNAPFNLGTNTILTTTDPGGNILFTNIVDGSYNLTINSQGEVTFNDTIGTTNTLNYLIVNAQNNNINLNNTLIRTSGNQTYNSPVILGNNLSLETTTTGEVLFEDTIQGPGGLNVNAQGEVTFTNMLGGTTPLANLSVNTTGDLNLGASPPIGTMMIKTLGSQTYNSPIILRQNNITLNAQGGLVFNSTIQGPFDLNLNAGGAGNILFTENVGEYGLPIGAMQILNAHNVTSTAGIYVTAFYQQQGTGTTRLNDPYGINRFTNLLYVGPYIDLGLGLTPDGTGPVTVKTDRIEGRINVGTLFIDVNSALLSGFIGGQEIGILQDIDAINAFSQPKLPPDVYILDESNLQEMLDNLDSGNFGFGYEFLDVQDDEFDYLLLLDPLECEVVEN